MTRNPGPNGPPLDLIAIGRCSVDLYGEQVGGRLEDMSSFAKYVGGCPTNISVGTARLGLRSAVITRVGDEHMGRFIVEQLTREGVDTGGIVTDPDRLTSLVVLGIRDRETFPLIFYRENCSDAALDEGDIDPEFIARARCIVVTGTHFTKPDLDRASRKAMGLGRDNGAKIVLDIDYRPVLWGLIGHGLGEERFVASRTVSAHLQTIVPRCDVIVGTEEEIHIAGGTTDTRAAIARLRELAPAALIVCKRGPMGCLAFDGPIPATIEDGIEGPGFPVEVYNVLGAGDAFMSGFLRGYLRDLPLAECCRYANACGAFAVSRHGCAPAMPSTEELALFLDRGSACHRLREDPLLDQVHWATTRRGDWPRVSIFAFDHRSQLEALAARFGVGGERISNFKNLALTAARRAAADRDDFGVLIDGRYGQDALDAVTGTGAWVGRAIEAPGSRPLAFDGGGDIGGILREWPVEQVVKCLCRYHPDDGLALRDAQEATLRDLQSACRRTGHELLLEIIPPEDGPPAGAATLASAIERLYGLGIHPDWWKLEDPGSDDGWARIDAAIRGNDPHCRGVVLLGLAAAEGALLEAFGRAARFDICKGFAVGRTVFQAAAESWFAGDSDDETAVDAMARSYGRLIRGWDQTKSVASAG